MTSTSQHFKNRNWYQCFKNELFKQPGVTSNMTVVEAAAEVAKTNPFIERQLEAIRISEEMGIGRSLESAQYGTELTAITRMDLVEQDYIARYVSLKDREFARAAGGKYRINVRARLRWCELFLAAESCV